MLLVVAGLVAPTLSLASTVVFDFEDGTTQGWSLSGGATLAGNGAVAGAYAIYGRDGASMSIQMDLTNVQAITMQRLYTGRVEDFAHFFTVDEEFLRKVHRRTFVAVFLSRPGTFTTLGFGSAVSENPDVWRFDVPPLSGEWTVRIIWDDAVCIPEDLRLCSFDTHPGYVDNVAFHPVPEHPVLLYLAMLSGPLVGVRWRTR